jgi:hypothetical protein
MADALPSPGADADDRGPVTDLTTLAGGLPFESALHPAGSGRSRWAQQELGDLLGPGWLDETAPSAPTSAPPEAPSSGAIWEVERMPSEAEGGVVGLLLGGRRDEPTELTVDRATTTWGGAAPDTPPSGLARLAEMLDHLPAERVARLTPDDVDVATTAPAPPGVWFWGDDDIYPGKVPGVVGARPTAKRRVRPSA